MDRALLLYFDAAVGIGNQHLALCPYPLAVAKCQFANCSVPNQSFSFEERMESSLGSICS